MPRITRRQFLVATLGLPPLLLTCGQPDESAPRTAATPAAGNTQSRLPLSPTARGTPEPAGSIEPREPVALWHFAWDDPIERRLWFSIRQQLEADLPHIQLSQEFHQRPVEELTAVSAAAGLPPDTVSIQDLFAPHWIERNLFVNIQSFVSAGVDDELAADVPGAALKTFRYYPEARRTGVGDYYGVPWRSNPRFLFVNAALLQDQGLAELVDRERWSIETVARAAPLLALFGPEDSLRRAAIGFPDSWFLSLPWLWSNEGDVLDTTGKTSSLAMPEVTRTYQNLQDWRHSNHVALRVGEFGSATYVQHFADNRLAMFLGGARDMFHLRETDVAWRAKSLSPAGVNESRTLAHYDGLAIVTGGQHIDAAWDFVTWALGREAQAHILASEQALPIRSEVIASSQIEPHYVATLLKDIHSQRTLPITATFPLYSPVIARHYHAMMNGGHAPVRETLSDLHSQLEFILDQHTLPSQWR